MAIGMELSHTFLHMRMDVPFEFLRFAWRYERIGVRGRRRLAGGAHNHAGGLDEQAAILALHLVAERHFDAIALVGSQDQWLDHIALETSGHGPWIEALLITRDFVLGF